MTFWIPEPLKARRYVLPARPEAVVGVPGRQAVMGGVTSAAAIWALEQVTGHPLLSASTQFLGPALPERDLEIEIDVLARSTNTSQARATLRDGDRLVLCTQATLGRPDDVCTRARHAPSVPAPAEIDQPPAGREGDDDGVLARFERRIARSDNDARRQLTWFRCAAAETTDAALLGVIADFLAGAHRDVRGSINLDCALRIAALEESRWILTDTQVLTVGERRYSGTMDLYAESGAHLATVSQTGQRPRQRAQTTEEKA